METAGVLATGSSKPALNEVINVPIGLRKGWPVNVALPSAAATSAGANRPLGGKASRDQYKVLFMQGPQQRIPFTSIASESCFFTTVRDAIEI